MKRISIFCIIMLLLTLCGCQKQPEPDNIPKANHSNINAAQSEKNEPEQPQDTSSTEPIIDGIESNSGEAVSSYDPADFSDAPIRTPNSSLVLDISPKTVTEIINAVVPNGLIVTGRAYGTRVSYDDGINSGTKTNFLIDHVFYGDVLSGNTVTVSEGYVLRTDGEETFIDCLSNNYSYLQNDEYVLLLLMPSTILEGCYTPAQFALPIGEDCTEWSESYMTSLLDYFRGDKSVYAHPEDYSYTKTFQFKNGKTEEMPVYVIAQIWPQKNLSDAEMIAEMQDNLLVYLASEYKIKIWPTEHVNYSGTHCARTVSNMAKWQYP